MFFFFLQLDANLITATEKKKEKVPLLDNPNAFSPTQQMPTR